MPVHVGINRERLLKLLDMARAEDLGDHGDITSLLMPEVALQGEGCWLLRARQPGKFCGATLLSDILEVLAPGVHVDWVATEPPSVTVQAGEVVAKLRGNVRQMLAAERVMINLLQHLSGVATLTARYVAAVAGTHAKIYDTRKTTPGLRDLEKYAVRCGGGHNHRIGLYDAVLIKDNHLAGIPTARLSHSVFEMLNRLPLLPATPAFVEVECDSLEQVAELFKVVGVNVVLLDNFEPAMLREAVAMRDRAGLRGKVELEASGGATLETVRAIAETGVERISVGAITHSAPILDLGLDAE